MTENKDILNKLISGTVSRQVVDDSDLNDNDSNVVAASRVIQVRYKFYIAGLIILGLILYSWLLIPAIDKFNSKKSKIDDLEQQMSNLESREQTYNDTIGFVQDIEKYGSQILGCLNKCERSEDPGSQSNCLSIPECSQIPEYIQKNSSDMAVARSYLLAYQMEDDKMDVDERKIIENIDNFLLKADPFGGNSQTNGLLSRISIGEKEKFNEGLYIVPIQLAITFDDKNSLLSFINNVEQYIPEDDNLRVLYKIDKISYDIVNSNDPQDTIIDMYLYYYE